MAEPALRADALRNRRRILDAAAAAFAESGLDVGVAEIARRAGVGAGTIFRRFATKEDLIAAIVEARVEEVLGAAEECAAEDDPAEALRGFAFALTGLQARDRGFFDAVSSRIGSDPRLRDQHDRLLEALETLVARAQEAGVLRRDVEAVDVAVLCCAAAGTPAGVADVYPEVWKRYIGVILDGLRPEAARELDHPAPSIQAIDEAKKPGARRRTA